MQDQLYKILEKLIVKTNIQVNKEELKLQFSSHPSYPSLHALTGVLDHFNIPNLALRLAVNEDMLQQLPKHFIANIESDQKDILVLIEKKKNGIKITSNPRENKIITNEEFLKRWNGIVVAIEKDETVKETFESPTKKMAKWILSGLGILLVGYLILSNNSVFASTHFLLSIVGLIISVFILNHELGLQSNTTNNFCNLSEHTSCDAVLNSKGASFFGILKLSDISIIVFSCYCLCWLLFFVSGTSNYSILSIATLLAFPFVVYSLYYQYSVVKKWCPLCLSIASVLILQITALVVFGAFFKTIRIDVQTMVLFSMATLTSIGVWSFIKPLLRKKEVLEKTEIAHYKFKRNFSLFNVLLNEGDAFSAFNSIPGEIVLGNKDAKIEVVLVTSPFCYYCKKAHRDIDQLLHRIGDKVKLIIRFNANVNNPDDQLFQVASRLLKIYNTQSKNEILKALNEVYSDDVNLEHWINHKPYEVSVFYNTILKIQSDWCQTNAINFTPALYINNKLFPKEYDRKDLIYFIDDLTEQLDTTISTNSRVESNTSMAS
ncbi:vitamin K epoxide reductase family protein [Psychroserpens luteolus]|uniref:vitamin K epoxide reductase family protein n=1 Tax=Psychroserpens luteolus TaxID=2855840 RepID=UPI001E3FB1CF|nr:vitamin K epoxide reductase family protein [Psychroserpens luteolus]MCD2258644.1 thioredoxin domain-containing protein [Psychroserpens luteolus]